MSTTPEPITDLSQFILPPQDIDILSFCASNKLGKVNEWAEALKITQINQTTVALYSALPEINHLKTDISTRFAMLEVFWPVVQQCLQVFSKEFLQQPLILPPKAQKSAIISQALQKHFLDGYTLCIKELSRQKKLKGNKQELMLNCLYRAMTALSRLMLRSYQLYSPIPPKVWLRAHNLMHIAERYGLEDTAVLISEQSNTSKRSLRELYLQTIAMGCIHPNQLSQSDLNNTYNALSLWSKHIQIQPASNQMEDNLYILNMTKDAGPHEKIRGQEPARDQILELNFQTLVKHITSMSQVPETIEHPKSSSGFSIPSQMPATLIEHILDCWCHCSKRKQARKNIAIKAEACIGIIDCHYHISGKIEFEQFLNPNDPDDEGSLLSSDFDQLISGLSNNEQKKKTSEEKDSIFQVSIQNLSAGGYCLQWKDQLPNRIEAGELIGIREAGRRAWSIGIVRWIRQTKTTSQMGIQILCNQPIPYGASVTLDNGTESDYMRVIHIPAPTMSDQPPSILTTTIPFQEGRRTELKQDDNTTSIRLNKSFFSTGKLKLFGFETLEQSDQEVHDY